MVERMAFQSPAVSVYGAEQALVRNRERNQENRPEAERQSVREASRGEQVSISPEARRLAGEAENGQQIAEQTGYPQAVTRKQLERPEETQAAVAKSVAEAIRAYSANNAVANNLNVPKSAS